LKGTQHLSSNGKLSAITWSAVGASIAGCTHQISSAKAETMLGTILLIVLILLLIGSLPAWPYSRSWGYYPGGGIGLILLVVIILVLLGNI
jgi:hypothetical protein